MRFPRARLQLRPLALPVNPPHRFTKWQRCFWPQHAPRPTRPQHALFWSLRASATVTSRTNETADGEVSNAASDANGATAPSEDEGRWTAFCTRWNETLARRPVQVVIFFGAAGTLTWGTIFVSLSSWPAARCFLAMPEYAVGWLVMRCTMRLRMPFNAALAAPLAAAVPALSQLKISPLLACFAADTETRKNLQNLRERLETSPKLGESGRHLVQRFFSGSAKFVQWAEGPIDKYGLPYFISSKTTSLATLVGATAAASAGLDVPSWLAALGLSGELQSGAGLLACAAALNVSCSPLHFIGAVGVVNGLENFASRMWREQQEELRVLSRRVAAASSYQSEGERKEAASKLDTEKPEADNRVADDQEELTEIDVRNNLVLNVAILTLLIDIGVMLYIAKYVMTGTGSDAASAVVASDADDTIEVSTTETVQIVVGAADKRGASSSEVNHTLCTGSRVNDIEGVIVEEVGANAGIVAGFA
eukprot:TRINITY_DN40226_c0_g1_i1.p1 TRINITY_DN40226_c0_g1~~TRINITY_DN40226_c0_g1_i1.p1  ORF type:complete len:479 (-),score=77.10 TRINITY_DN40226_c0_g1_i1:231-1667(-)